MTFRESQQAAVQTLVLDPGQTEAVQRGTRENLSRKFANLRAADPDFAEYREARHEAQVPLAAINSLIGFIVVRRTLDGEPEYTPDMIKAYAVGTSELYGAAIEEILDGQCGTGGSHEPLLRYLESANTRHIDALRAMKGREWDLRGVAHMNDVTAEDRLNGAWEGNGMLMSSLFVMKAIGACLELKRLPSGRSLTKLARASIDDLSLITTANRPVFGTVIGGKGIYAKILKQLRTDGTVDTSYSSWMQGIIAYINDAQAKCPFDALTTESPLIYGTAAAHSSFRQGAWDNIGACSGQFTCRSADDVDNQRAHMLFGRLGVPIREDGGFSPFRLQAALGARVLGKTIFTRPEGRAALVAATESRQFVESTNECSRHHKVSADLANLSNMP